MNHDSDEQLGRLLQGALAPAPQDPVFRIRVLERRERQQFRRRVALLVGGAVAASLIYAIGSAAAGTMPSARVWGIALALVVGAAMYVPALVSTMRGLGK